MADTKKRLSAQERLDAHRATKVTLVNAEVISDKFTGHAKGAKLKLSKSAFEVLKAKKLVK